MHWMDVLHSIVGDDNGVLTLPQMISRAVIVFFVGLVLVRVTTPRIFSRTTPIDIVLAIIIGSNLSRTLTGNAPFLKVLAATIVLVGLHALITRAAVRYQLLANLVKGKPHVLVREGTIDWETMTACAIGERDLHSAVRKAGGTEIENVKLATMERGGSIQVVLRE